MNLVCQAQGTAGSCGLSALQRCVNLILLVVCFLFVKIMIMVLLTGMISLLGHKAPN